MEVHPLQDWGHFCPSSKDNIDMLPLKQEALISSKSSHPTPLPLTYNAPQPEDQITDLGKPANLIERPASQIQ